jgi:hypothetical protein
MPVSRHNNNNNNNHHHHHHHNHLHGLDHARSVPSSWRVRWPLHLNWGRPVFHRLIGLDVRTFFGIPRTATGARVELRVYTRPWCRLFLLLSKWLRKPLRYRERWLTDSRHWSLYEAVGLILNFAPYLYFNIILKYGWIDSWRVDR